MEGIVYHIFNTSNGKAYVGQTWDTLGNRWKQHCRTDGEMVVMRAIRKHGPESFVRTVLTRCGNQKDLDAAEDTFILELDTLHPDGYNLRRGGSHGRHTDESRRKMSESHRGQKPHPMSAFGELGRLAVVEKNRGSKMSSKSKEKMRQAKIGVPRSEEAKRAVSTGMKQKVAPKMMKPVVCLNDGKTFTSAQEASVHYGVNVARVANGTRKHAKRLRFTYMKKTKEFN